MEWASSDSFFFWTVCHGMPLTNTQRVCQHLVNNATCPSCQSCPETILHVLRDCTKAKQTWNQFLKPVDKRNFFQMDSRNWVLNNLKSKKMFQCGIPWSLMFGYVCWFIWNSWNQLIFFEMQHIQDPIQVCCRLARASVRAQCYHQALSHTTSIDREHYVWKPPYREVLKINVDATLDF